ncbi:MAG: hypothetical protein ISR65_02510 [Bacteriovoracaceae bacterium]|nr:hypothetical protein [Bacteriovoracaceae bacterium]
MLLLLSSRLLAGGELQLRYKFRTKVISPSITTRCGTDICVYSLYNNQIIRLDKNSGKVKYNIDLGKRISNNFKATAIEFLQNSFLIAGVLKSDPKSYPLYLLPLTDSAKKITWPGEQKTHIRDINCTQRGCLLFANKVHISKNQKNWQVFSIPRSVDILPVGGDLKSNPFFNWQEKFIVSRGRYTSSTTDNDNNLFVLNSLRSTVAFTDDSKWDNWKKWGKWGVWEGQMMSPKAIAYLNNYNAVAVADSGLKFIFVFDRQGLYIGKISSNPDNERRFLYPIDVVAINDDLFVADFFAGELIAINIVSLTKPDNKRPKTVDEFLHKDLLKDLLDTPQAKLNYSKEKCLACHDGSESFNLDKFVGIKNHHPINVEVKSTISLPLKDGKFIACNTCHDQHHDKTLRKEYKSLCLTCHQDKAKQSSNHFNLNLDLKSKLVPGKKVSTCKSCHAIHESEHNLKIKTNSQLCLDCHGTKQAPISHPFKEDHVHCLSCHALHGAKKSHKFARHSKPEVSDTCVTCHYQLKVHLGKNKHLSKKDGKVAHPWPGGEGVCMDCHNPHKRKKTVKKLCLSCHKDKKRSHVKNNIISKTKRAKTVKLDKGQMSCFTCHNHHGISENKKFINNKKDILGFCSSCHGAKSSKLLNNYHKRLKRK